VSLRFLEEIDSAFEVPCVVEETEVLVVEGSEDLGVRVPKHLLNGELVLGELSFESYSEVFEAA
jgi:hypothetical protein